MLSSAAGGLLLASTASTTMKTIFPPPPPSLSLSEKTKKIGKYSSTTNRRTNFNQLAPAFCWGKVIKTKLRQKFMSDPGGYSDRLRGYQLLGGWRALLLGRGGSFGTLRWYPRLEHFYCAEDFSILFQEKGKQFGTPYVIDICGASLFLRSHKEITGSDDGTRLCKLRATNGWQGTPWSHGARWQARSGVQGIRFFLHTKSWTPGDNTTLPASNYIHCIILVLKSMARFLLRGHTLIVFFCLSRFLVSSMQ